MALKRIALTVFIQISQRLQSNLTLLKSFVVCRSSKFIDLKAVSRLFKSISIF